MHASFNINDNTEAGQSGPAPEHRPISGGADDGAGLGQAAVDHPGEDSDDKDLYASSTSEEE